MKKILFINSQAPHGASAAQEALDVLLMASTFAQDISVLFLDDGVWQLKKDQDTALLNTKNFSKTFKAFELYDIENIYVAHKSLEERGLNAADLMIKVSILNTDNMAELVAQQDHVVSF